MSGGIISSAKIDGLPIFLGKGKVLKIAPGQIDRDGRATYSVPFATGVGERSVRNGYSVWGNERCN
jgi:hypothetical protein